MKNPTSEIRLQNHGSIWLARPLTAAGAEWIDEHIPNDAQWFGGALVIQNHPHRMGANLG
jgi:hypothetical protein